MTKEFSLTLILVVTIIIAMAVLFDRHTLLFSYQKVEHKKNFQQETTMIITSPVFKHNEFVPKKYTCDEADVNPPLEISGVPDEAKSLALIVDDPDAPVGLWVHWTVWNMDPRASVIAEKTVPEGAMQGMTNFGRIGYGGPCPPKGSGTHRYFFKLYALDIMLNLQSDSDKTKVEEAMRGHILAEAMLIGLYTHDN